MCAIDFNKFLFSGINQAKGTAAEDRKKIR